MSLTVGFAHSFEDVPLEATQWGSLGSPTDAASGRRGSLAVPRDFERSDEVDEPYEVVIPVEDDHIGHLDAEELYENVNTDALVSPPGEAQEVESDHSHIETKMVFYFQHQPTFIAETLGDLKGSSLLKSIEDSVFWLDVHGYDLGILRKLAKIFGIHPLTVEDIWDEEHREKCELYEDYTFVCIKGLLEKNLETGSRIDAGVLYIICAEKYVITFHMDSLSQFEKVHKRLDGLENIALTPGWIFYTIVDNVVDGYLPAVDISEMECNSIDELVLLFSVHSQSEILQRISRARKSVSLLLKLVSHKSDIFKMIQTRNQKLKRALFQKDVLLYLDDVHGHVLWMEQNLGHQDTVINRAHSGYLTQVSVELTQASNRLGATLKKFTAGACIFLPLSLTAGLMGVNVRVPFQLGGPNDSPVWFYVLLIFMLTIALVLVLIGRKFGWFSPPS